jgi:hypothetical protein
VQVSVRPEGALRRGLLPMPLRSRMAQRQLATSTLQRRQTSVGLRECSRTVYVIFISAEVAQFRSTMVMYKLQRAREQSQ